jgi:hypothetical protein
MSLTHIFQQRTAPNSEKVLRRILHEDEIWYWDPATNVVEKRASKHSKKDNKKELRDRRRKEKKEMKEQEKKEQEKKERKETKKARQGQANANRKTLTTSGTYLLLSCTVYSCSYR